LALQVVQEIERILTHLLLVTVLDDLIQQGSRPALTPLK
jgi:hypothetical protein